ncbi:Protein FAM92A [Lamellibrachia satsuma]|nr:Protein FAM92A [Lamellibrachia satsuma]
MSRTGAEIRASETQAKEIQDRVGRVEKHFGDMCTNFGAYSRKVAKLRDKGDELARNVREYAEQEKLNHTMQQALKDFSEKLSAVQDYRESEMKRMEIKVIEPLTLYGTQCKQAKERLKSAFAARDRESRHQRSLSKARDRNPNNRHQIKEAEFQQASLDASHAAKNLEEEIEKFEKKKLQDVKDILGNFAKLELMFHAKALEMYTQCYQSIAMMNEDEDLEEFRSSLHPSPAQSRLDQQQASSRTSLNMAGQSGPPSYGQVTPTPRRRSIEQQDAGDTLNQSSMYTTGHDEEDDEDDDDDDDDEEDTENSDHMQRTTGKQK